MTSGRNEPPPAIRSNNPDRRRPPTATGDAASDEAENIKSNTGTEDTQNEYG